MKLLLTRDQGSGLLGAVKFKLRAQVKLTKREAGLVRKYRAGREVLLQRQIKIPFTSKLIRLDIGIAELINGQVFQCKDIADILEYERNVKEACETFRNYLQVMSTFGGEEVIHYTGLSPDDEDAEIDPFDDVLLSAVTVEATDASSDEATDHTSEEAPDDTSEAVAFQGIGFEPEAIEQGSDEHVDFCYHCGAGVPANSTSCAVCQKTL